MSVLFDSVSRKPGRRVRGRTLLIFIAITFALLNTPEPTHSVPQQACNTNITVWSNVKTNFTFGECEPAAKTNAGNKALQAVENQAVCPQACPTRIWVTAPHITWGPVCEDVQINGYTRYYGLAGAEGTYQCVNLNP